MFVPAGEQFVLLDSTRRVTAEVTMKEVAAFNEWQRHWAMEQPSPVLNFFGNPLFQESFDRSASELTLSSAWVTYKVKLTAADKGVVEQYHQFSDWYARLNAGLNPKARPPFARMMVNAAIARQGAIPAEIQMTATVKNKTGEQQTTTIRCQYRLIFAVDQGRHGPRRGGAGEHQGFQADHLCPVPARGEVRGPEGDAGLAVVEQ